MKTITALLIFLLVGFHSSAQAERANIIKSIESESDAWVKGDTAALWQSWQHSPDISYSFFSRNAYTVTKGWDSLRATLLAGLANKQASTARSPRENYMVMTNGTMASVEYDQIPVPSNAPFPVSRVHHQRLLVKNGKQWKTVSEVVTVPETYNSTNFSSLEESLNSSGYMLLQQSKLDEAIEVFKLNVKLFPNSWNTYDSLGEAYALAGDKNNAIENYEHSIRINPKNDNGVAALAKLKKP